jgi:hypothetical protein
MNPRYRQTFSRHPVLFSLPLVLTAFLALWAVLGAPKTYQSSASLWVDTPAPSASSLDQTNPTLVTPAAQAQQLLAELMTTRRFRLEIGHSSPLAKYLSQSPSSGWGPSAFLARLHGTMPVDDRVVAALDPKHVLTLVAGPQVLALKYRGPTPAVTQGTLKALLTEFDKERRDLDVGREQGRVAYFKTQVGAASRALQQARTDIANYGGIGLSDRQVHALVQAETVATSRLSAATRAYNHATLSLAAARAERTSTRVIDPPELPIGPATGKKKAAFALVAGLFVGGLISFLGLVLFSGEARPREDELTARDVEVELVPSSNGAAASIRDAPASAPEVAG